MTNSHEIPHGLGPLANWDPSPTVQNWKLLGAHFVLLATGKPNREVRACEVYFGHRWSISCVKEFNE